MCSAPVTFGGGITMEYGFLSEVAAARKYPLVSHSKYHLFSTSWGSYPLASSLVICLILFMNILNVIIYYCWLIQVKRGLVSSWLLLGIVEMICCNDLNNDLK